MNKTDPLSGIKNHLFDLLNRRKLSPLERWKKNSQERDFRWRERQARERHKPLPKPPRDRYYVPTNRKSLDEYIQKWEKEHPYDV